LEYFVAKVVKTIGCIAYSTETLDEFRYTKALFWHRKNASQSCVLRRQFVAAGLSPQLVIQGHLGKA
jgi:hypothetical protein